MLALHVAPPSILEQVRTRYLPLALLVQIAVTFSPSLEDAICGDFVSGSAAVRSFAREDHVAPELVLDFD